MRGTRGQQIGEYAVLLGVVATAFIASQMYMTRRISGGLIATAQQVLGAPVAQQGTNTSFANSTTIEAGDVDRTRTTITGGSGGASSAGHILAEPSGSYVWTVSLDPYYSAGNTPTLLLKIDPMANEPDIDGDGDVDLFDRPKGETIVLRDQNGDGTYDVIGGFEASDIPDVDGDGIADLGILNSRGEAAKEGPLESFFGNDATFTLDTDNDERPDLVAAFTAIADIDADQVKTASVRSGKAAVEKDKQSQEKARALLRERFKSDEALEAAEYLLLDSPQTGVIFRAQDAATGDYVSVEKRLKDSVKDITDPEGALAGFLGEDGLEEVLDSYDVKDMSPEEFKALIKEVADPGSDLHAAFTESNAYVLNNREPASDVHAEKRDTGGQVVLKTGKDGSWELGEDVSGTLVTREFKTGGKAPSPSNPIFSTTDIKATVPVGIDRNNDGDVDDTGDVQFLQLGQAGAANEINPGAVATVKADGTLSTPQLLVTHMTVEGQVDEATGLWDSHAKSVNGHKEGDNNSKEIAEVLLPMKTKDGIIVGWVVLGKEGSESSSGLTPSQFVPDLNHDGQRGEDDMAAARANPISILPKPSAAPEPTGPPADALMTEIPTGTEAMGYGLTNQETTSAGQTILFHRENANQVPPEDQGTVTTGISREALVQTISPVDSDDIMKLSVQMNQRVLATALIDANFEVMPGGEDAQISGGPLKAVPLMNQLQVSEDFARGILQAHGIEGADADSLLQELNRINQPDLNGPGTPIWNSPGTTIKTTIQEPR